jgi:hypothetical protein
MVIDFDGFNKFFNYMTERQRQTTMRRLLCPTQNKGIVVVVKKL